MGIFDALTTAVAGLQAQSFALQDISGNIANSQTTGYKETNTSFEDLVAAAAAGNETSDGVIAQSVATNTVAGDIENTSVSTDMAIQGNGWFVVAQPTGEVDNQPTFSGVNAFTQAGDFALNANGYLVNGAGYYLMGIPIDAATGNPVGSSPQVLQFNNDFIPAQETTAIQYQANLPSSPTSGLLVPSDYEANASGRSGGRGNRRHGRDARARRGGKRYRLDKLDSRHDVGLSRDQHGRHCYDRRRHQLDIHVYGGRDQHGRGLD